MRKAVIAGIGACVLALSACNSGGSEKGEEAGSAYPESQMTIYSPFPPGGGIDLAINSVMQALQEADLVDAQMRLSNLPGGSGMVATATLASNHDGADDTLLLTSVSNLSATVQESQNVGLSEMVPLAGLYAEYTYVYVRNDSPFQSLGEIVSEIEADAGGVIIGGASLGSADNIVVAELARGVGVKFEDLAYIPLPGDENASNLLGGQIDVSFGGPDLLNLVESGDARVLAVSAPERLTVERVASIPTIIESGYDVTQANWRGVFGPPNMPDYAVEYWSTKLMEMVETPQWQAIADQNVWDTTGLNREEFSTFLSEEEENLRRILTDLGLVT
ncbi:MULTISPECIES: Bug family tripartite tricarboxylate transporter substrate binding protein [unclassified Micromonospora]|uniref:Bug family tripartite tricarboxylate transporter substrate binding protein n=1 Tax=unclassified Micromonospora TaxID=2617518 RepID=UPI003A835F56